MSNIIISGLNPDGEKTSVLVPITCDDIVLVRRRPNSTLRGIATIHYAGITITNIQIHEYRGEVTIRFPYTTFTRRNGSEGQRTIAHPNNTYLGTQINHIVLNKYSEAILSNSGYSTLILNESDSEPAKPAETENTATADVEVSEEKVDEKPVEEKTAEAEKAEK